MSTPRSQESVLALLVEVDILILYKLMRSVVQPQRLGAQATPSGALGQLGKKQVLLCAEHLFLSMELESVITDLPKLIQ